MPSSALALIGVIAALLFAPSADAAVPAQWPGNVNCVSITGLGHFFQQGLNCRAFRFGGVTRRYVAWVPPGAKQLMERNGRVPVVAMLHGSSGTGEQFFKHSGWRETATKNDFIAVFPTARKYRIDDGGGQTHMSTRWAEYNLADDIVQPPAPANDVGFLKMVAADVNASAHVDPRRVYLSGFSNGGSMCLRAALELTGALAAVGCNAGALHSVHHLTAGRPHIPVVLTFGSLDDNLVGGLHAEDPSITEVPMNPTRAFQFQVMRNLVAVHNASFDVTDQADVLLHRRTVFNLRFDDPVQGVAGTSQFQFMVLKDVEHEYPTRTNNPHHFRMADMLWAFFRAHPKP